MPRINDPRQASFDMMFDAMMMLTSTPALVARPMRPDSSKTMRCDERCMKGRGCLFAPDEVAEKLVAPVEKPKKQKAAKEALAPDVISPIDVEIGEALEDRRGFERRYGRFPDCWEHVDVEKLKHGSRKSGIELEILIGLGDDGVWWWGTGAMTSTGGGGGPCSTGPYKTRNDAVIAAANDTWLTKKLINVKKPVADKAVAWLDSLKKSVEKTVIDEIAQTAVENN